MKWHVDEVARSCKGALWLARSRSDIGHFRPPRLPRLLDPTISALTTSYRINMPKGAHMNTRTRIVIAAVSAAGLIAAGSGMAAVAVPGAATASTHTAAASTHTTATASTHTTATARTHTAAATHVTQPTASRQSTGFSWHPLHLLNGWTALSPKDYGAPSYAVKDGVLYLSGILQAPNPTYGPEFAVLPAGARPSHFLWIIYYNFGGSGTNLIGNMEIQPDGDMFAYSNGGQTLDPSLQAISFPLSS
jgi:hypothetical protein